MCCEHDVQYPYIETVYILYKVYKYGICIFFYVYVLESEREKEKEKEKNN